MIVLLRFLGRGSAFNSPHNCACFTYGQTLVLLDCSMDSFQRLITIGPDRLAGTAVDGIRVLVTHTHGDHISGIPMLIHYCYYIYHLPVTVGAPSAEVLQDLKFYFDRLDGCDPAAYRLILSEEMPDIVTRVIPTEHSPELSGRCFGYQLQADEETVVYTGDTGTLEPFLPFLKAGTDLYTEASVNRSPVHLYLPDILDVLTGLTEQGTGVFLMHLDNEERIRELIQNTAIRLAPLYQS